MKRLIQRILLIWLIVVMACWFVPAGSPRVPSGNAEIVPLHTIASQMLSSQSDPSSEEGGEREDNAGDQDLGLAHTYGSRRPSAQGPWGDVALWHLPRSGRETTLDVFKPPRCS